MIPVVLVRIILRTIWNRRSRPPCERDDLDQRSQCFDWNLATDTPHRGRLGAGNTSAVFRLVSGYETARAWIRVNKVRRDRWEPMTDEERTQAQASHLAAPAEDVDEDWLSATD